MFGPLPVLHRTLTLLGALTIGIGIGAWSGLMPAIPISLLPGILLGTTLGLGAAYLLLHDAHHGSTHPPSRGRRRLR